MTETKPNPGSKEAIEMGCLCPVLDNSYGIGYLGGARTKEGNLTFVVSGCCPVHNKNPDPLPD